MRGYLKHNKKDKFQDSSKLGGRIAHRGDGFVLIEVLLLCVIITLSVSVFAIILPIELRLDNLSRERSAATDKADFVAAWVNTFVSPLDIPLLATTGDSLSYHTSQNGAPDVCYLVQLNRASGEITARWGDTITGGQCPSSLDKPSSGPLVLVKNVVNQTQEPLFTYYTSRDESTPVEAGTQASLQAKSITMRIRLSRDNQTNPLAFNKYHILLSAAVDSSALKSSVVTSSKLADGAVGTSKIDIPALNMGKLANGGVEQFNNVPILAGSKQNFGLAEASLINHWHDNTNSPAVSQGGADLTAGDGLTSVTLINLNDACRQGFLVEGRAVYTIYNPPNGGAITAGARLRSEPDSGLASDAAGTFETIPASIPGGTHKNLTSAWQVIDFGNCPANNYLLTHSPFLYKIETISNSLQPYTIVNAFIQLRYLPISIPTGNPAPLAPETLSPKSDISIVATSSLVLSGRFLDPNPSAQNGAINFQLCSNQTCSAVLDQGQSQNNLANGGRGQWTTTYNLQANHIYYWRAQGVDTSGQLGPWSDVSSINVAP